MPAQALSRLAGGEVPEPNGGVRLRAVVPQPLLLRRPLRPLLLRQPQLCAGERWDAAVDGEESELVSES